MRIVVLYCIVSFIVCGRRHPAKHQPQLISGHSSRVFLLFLEMWMGFGWATSAQVEADSSRRLDEVQVRGVRTPTTLRTAAPTQVVEATRLEEEGALLLSDALKQMAGVTLKDYGGVGGIKTVSARGLGSQFSTLTIDGVPVDDAQNGQVDLGRYMLGNAAYVSLSQGHEQSELLSARAYAAGSVISMETHVPTFFMAERDNLRLGMEVGSFGMLSPSGLWEHKWRNRLVSSLWVNYLCSEGDYPFTLYYTSGRDELQSRERRQHSAMAMFTSDANLFYSLNSHSRLSAKVHYMQGRHELPGPVQLYSQEISKEQTAEQVAFGQLRWHYVRGRWKAQVLGKLQYTYDHWEDSSADNSLTGYAFNRYEQTEGYLSGAVRYELLPGLTLGLSTDGDVSHLSSNLAHRNDVERHNAMAVMAADYRRGPLALNANILYTNISDHVADLDTMPHYERLSPYLGATFTFGQATTLRYFYKETYRAPNFSELYFFTMPRSLNPERARQHNVGLTYANNIGTITVDAYYNRVNDKIVAVPTQSMFLWSMQNVGIVHILGVDVTSEVLIGLPNSSLSLRANYSFQRALDRTNPDDKTYGHQIAYTPRHSGGLTLRWEHRVVNLGGNILVVGERYYRMQNTPQTRLPAYCDVGLNADRRFNLRLGTLRVQTMVLNLFNVQYEVVRSYPMMGRNYRLGLIYEF